MRCNEGGTCEAFRRGSDAGAAPFELLAEDAVEVGVGEIGELDFLFGGLDFEPFVIAEISAGAAVELDGGRGRAGLLDDADADGLVGADDERAIGEGVRADGGEDDGVGVGAEDGAVGSEGVGGRAGGGWR